MDKRIGALEVLAGAQTDPIAIIGMGCRFPGKSHDPESFWRLLYDGVNAIAEVPHDRWDLATYYDPDPEAAGKIYTCEGGFLESIEGFDAPFFNLSPREACLMSPQQRLLLEVAWETFEHAHQAPDQLYGSATGVFVGMSNFDYATLPGPGGPAGRDIDAYMVTGNVVSVAAGRLSYTLGLTGPSMVIDTACASSLVAVHHACQSLRLCECHLALAGGVHLMLSPEVTIALCRLKALAPDGRSKTFEAAADGFARAEGCGLIALKRLSDALANGDSILALIRGSAVNQDGASGGLTVPSGRSQRQVIQQALDHAGITPQQIQYIEAHGTGTILGDPIEIEALARLCHGRPPTAPLVVGSVKTNIGHLEAAAGIAGLIKVVLALQHEVIPPHLHFKQPHPYIPWDALEIVIPTKRRAWAKGAQARLAGVSAFGFSGTNAHVVLEEAPELASNAASDERPLHILALSAKTPAALQQLIQRYVQYLAAHPSAPLADICYSANTGRTHFNHRLSVLAASTQEPYDRLTGWSVEQMPPSITPLLITLLFTGHGTQYAGMRREIYRDTTGFPAYPGSLR